MSPRDLLLIGASLLCLGLYGVLTRRNAVAILLAIELMLNAANINIVAVARLLDPRGDGQIVALFVIALAACEAVVGLAIIIQLTHSAKTIWADHADLLKG